MKYFNYKDYNLKDLIREKNVNNITIGVALPVLNEEKTLDKTLKIIKGCNRLIDEVIVIDSGSTDKSKQICRNNGIKFIDGKAAAKALKVKYRKGKGWNLWSSLFYLNTDIVIWIDSDIVNIGKRFIFGIIAPMIVDHKVKFVKGYYERPKGDARVTEIMVRPLINILFPKLKNVIQPLSGEYGGRREFLEKINFYSGYSVEMGVLIQAFNILGGRELAQVYLGKRIHELQTVSLLGRMSASILLTMMKISKEIGINKFNIKLSKTLRQFTCRDKVNYNPIDLRIDDYVLPKMIENKIYNTCKINKWKR